MITPLGLRHYFVLLGASIGLVAVASLGPAMLRSGAAPQELRLWCATGTPVLQIGSPDDRSGGALDGVVGAHRFADGRLVVANAGSYELRFFDARGRHRRSTGGPGDGPGEFRQLVLLRSFAGDSLLSFDARHMRASVFGPDGEFIRSFRMPEADGFVVVADVFADGSSVARVNQGYRSDEAVTGRHRASIRLLELDREGALRRDLGLFPGDESYVLASDGSMIAGPLVFGASLHVAALRDEVVVGVSDETDLRFPGRSRPRRVSLALDDVQRLRATEADFRLVAGQYLEDFPQSAREIERQRFDGMPRVEVLPVFAELRADPAGQVWLRHQLRPDDSRRTWMVLDASGVPIARARTPDDTDILEIGSDHVLVLARDELGVERLEVRPIERRSGLDCE